MLVISMTKTEQNEPMEYTKYEIARMLGSRALQISQGAPFLVKISDKELEEIKYSPLEIAKREFAAGVLPITVKRPYPLPGQKKR